MAHSKPSRRQFTLATLATGLTAQQMNADTPDTPVMQVFREWSHMMTWLESPTSGLTESELDGWLDVTSEIEEKMVATPAQDGRDVLAKIAAVSQFGIYELPDRIANPEFWAEATLLLGYPE